MVGLLGGVYLTTLGYDVYGPLLSGGSIVALVTAFIYGTKSRSQEREKKFESVVK